MQTSFQNEVVATLRRVKQEGAAGAYVLPVVDANRPIARLEPVTWSDVKDPAAVALLARWRESAADAFPSQFPVTLEGTQRWLVKQLLELPDRVLFWVKSPDGARIGHVGLYRFDFTARQAEIDNIVRGSAGVIPGVMYASVQTLLDWSFECLGLETLTLHVFGDNPRAIRLYERCGFQETGREPLVRVQEGAVIRWVDDTDPAIPAQRRHFVVMTLPRDKWRGQLRRNRAAA